MSTFVEQLQKNPLLRDLAMSAAFGIMGVAAQSNKDPLISHLAGAAIGFGFGYAIRSLMLHRAAVKANIATYNQ